MSPRTRLLLAEDDEFSRDMLTRRLERLGFEVIAVPHGREAILAARQHRPDAIIMDLDMPVMDGWSATRSLKSDPKTYRIPVIALTAHASPREVEQAHEAGCDAFETKPVTLKRLLDRITEVLNPRAPQEVSS